MHKKPRPILAIDPGLREIGYAVLAKKRLVTSGVLSLRAEPRGKRLTRVREALDTWTRAYRPRTVVLEHVPKRPLDSIAGLPALGRLVRRFAKQRRLAFATYSAKTVRQGVVGDGWATKCVVAKTLTRADGEYDMVVNGGGPLTVRFSKLGYLEAQRQLTPTINTYTALDDVGMIGRSFKRTPVDLEVAQVVRTRFATDANGDRELRLYFPGQMRARITNPITPADSEFRHVAVRATEYTQGTEGAAAMPALLPPSSAYTYCVELSLDEADSLANASGEHQVVRFTKGVSSYVPNFLGYPVGTRVPLGYFDRMSSQWVAEKDAIVLKIVGQSGDTALVDVDGDDVADAQAKLDSLELGLTGEERRVLLAEYGIGEDIWRAQVDHFSPGDMNGNQGPPEEALPNGPSRLFQLLTLLFGPCLSEGSIIECENRVLGERIAVKGTPYTLNYRSFRAPGDSAVRTVHVPILGDTVPETLTGVAVVLEVAGKVYRKDFAAIDLYKDQVVSMRWDGLDVYGRRIPGSAEARVSVGYQYDATARGGLLVAAGAFGNSALSAGAELPIADDRRVPRMSWTRRTLALGVPGTGSDGLGGWTLSPHHIFDPNGRGAVYYGSGEVDPGDRIPLSRWTVAQSWDDQACPSIDDSLISRVPNGTDVTALTLGPDGTLYFADACRGSVYRFGEDGVLHLVAGSETAGEFDIADNGGPATDATFKEISDITVAPDGSLYFVFGWGSYDAVGRVTSDGTLHHVVGDGQFHVYGTGDNGPVTDAETVEVSAVAIGPDGALFFAEDGTQPDLSGSYSKIRRVGTDGIITTYAGSEWCRSSSDSTGLATEVCLSSMSDLLVDDEGTLYALEGSSHRVRRITRDGLVSSFFYINNTTFNPNQMSFAPDGSIYLANGAGSASQQPPVLATHGVYRLDPDANLTIVAGGLGTGTVYEGAPVTTVPMWDVSEIAVLPDGTYYVVAGFELDLVRHRFATDLGGEWMVPSQDGSEMHYFSKTGRHLRTRDALTGTFRYWFDYDVTHGDLTAVHDVDGGTTTISRHPTTRVPTEIEGPDGQKTTLTLTSGLLTKVIDPGGFVTSLAYQSNGSGLLDSLTDANGHRSTFTWDGDGRLERDTNAEDGYQDLDQTEMTARSRTVLRKTALGRETTYETELRDDGTTLRTVTNPSDLSMSSDFALDTRVVATFPDGVTVTDSIAPDPRFWLVAPVPAGRRVVLPSGLGFTSQVTRPYAPETFNPPDTSASKWIEQTIRNGSDTTRVEFDGLNLRYTTQRSLVRKITGTVDSVGRPLATYVPGLDTLRREYDSRGRLSELRQGQRIWLLRYDSNGRLDFVRDTLGRMTTFDFDDAGRLTSRTLPGGRQTTFGYDAHGNVASLTPPGRPAHGFTYTEINAPTDYLPPSAGLSDSSTKLSYDLDGALVAVSRPDSTNVSLDYDGTSGRLDEVSTPRGEWEWSYDAKGRTASISSPDSVFLSFAYDGALDTLEGWTGAVAGTVSVALDRSFRVSSQRVNSSHDAIFGYDNDGLITQAGDLSIDRRVDNGFITGTSLSGSSVSTLVDYNSHGEVKFAVGLSGSDTLLRAWYLRDALGRITQINENILGAQRSWEYAYSDTGFLTTVTLDGTVVQRFGYDLNGNRLRYDAIGYGGDGSYDDQDRLTQYGDTSYTYTAPGELLERVVGSDTTHYGFDALGNLLSVGLPGGDLIEYLIDGRGRRVGRKLNGDLTHQWLYQDRWEPVAEFNGEGSLVWRYVYGTQSHVPEYMVGSDTTYRILTDHLGSARLVVNAATGMIAQRVDYDAFGRVTLDSSPGFQSFGYAGGLWDPTTGLVHLGARDYDPQVGRWTRRDPIRFEGGSTNLYLYVNADPLNLIDPTGTDIAQPIQTRSPDKGFFAWYGNWGGPGYSNNSFGDELKSNVFLPSHGRFVRPVDARDELYRQHDYNLRQCARINDEVERRKCRREADLNLARSLASLPWCDPNRYLSVVEQIFFLGFAPNGRSPDTHNP